MQNIKAIIFDLGGVLLNIDFNKTSAAFKNLGVKDFDGMYSQINANPLFQHLEEGKINEEEFYKAFRKSTNLQLSDDQIKNAWNALLLDFRKESLAYLELLKPKYKLYLFSNTNIIHFGAFNKIYATSIGGEVFDKHFNKAYYSYQIGFRKPDASAYNFVLKENNLIAEHTLLIDDSITNIEGARALGISTHWLTERMSIEDLDL